MLYVLVGIAIYYLSGYLGWSDNSRGIIRSCIVVLLVLLAARVFRAEGEESVDPRPLWRMTGRPTAGFVLGSITGLVAIGLVLYGFGIESQPQFHRFVSQEPYVVVSAILFAGLAVLYLTSSARLVGLLRERRAEADRIAEASRKTKP
jgi:uncharacterized membrane protein YfcA